MSSNITNRNVKPFIEAVDLYPGFKLEEQEFSKAIIKDVDSKSKKTKDQEPTTWPRERSSKHSGYELFMENALNTDTGQFYPEKDQNGVAKKGSGLTYYINAIYRIRRVTGEEFLFTKGMAYAFDSHGDPIHKGISMPEVWTKVLFTYKTEYNDKTKQMEKVLQGPSGSQEIYMKPFTKENLKELFERRQNDLIQFAVKKEGMDTAVEVKDVTGNLTKSYELLRDQPFDYLFAGNHIPLEIKQELRAAAVADGLIGGTVSDYNQPAKSSTTPAKNTYQ